MNLIRIRIETDGDNTHSYRYRRRLHRRHHRDHRDDISETWSLPSWPELDGERRLAQENRRRLRRSRRKATKSITAGSEAVSSAASAGGVGSLGLDSIDTEVDGDDVSDRQLWSNPCEFLLTMVSMSVGLGNFYRFPYICFENGGGAFLIPYLVIMTLIGRPLYFMELAVGQFSSYGQVKVWKMCPAWIGVGIGSAVASFCVLTYFSSIMATTIYYIVHSFQATLPWAECDPEWATEEVCDRIKEGVANGTNQRNIINLARLYYEREVINEKADINDGIGLPEWKLTLCLAASWLIFLGILFRGVESSGKVAYFTTIYPFVVIFTLLGYTMTREGAFDGMLFFVNPKWFAAAGQAFFSLNMAFGPIINYASMNTFHHSIYKDVIVVSFMDTFASFIAGLAVFAVLGTLSHELSKPIEEVVSSGPGLIFVSFSDAISLFPVPQLFSILFFLMMMTLAIGASTSWVMALSSIVRDQFPQLKLIWLIVGMCILGFLSALIYVTPGGQFMVTLVDNFGGNVNIYMLATLEAIGIAWVYGIKNFSRDVEFMLGTKIGWYWKICWAFCVPVLLLVIMVYSFATLKPLEYKGQSYPPIALACGWAITALSIIPFPIGVVYSIYKTPGTLKEKIVNCIKPTNDYGPKHPQDRYEWDLFKEGKLMLDDVLPDDDTNPLKTDVETPNNDDKENDAATAVPGLVSKSLDDVNLNKEK
ncbi:unnamed protein product [Orchesella dallaii]|uniref:Sodium-dependent nutrient amino acid transporter 1 n=1 Tax=Orchesella dallaii TaxID=48710 RepID=A0ABP1RSX9_9HEXA